MMSYFLALLHLIIIELDSCGSQLPIATESEPLVSIPATMLTSGADSLCRGLVYGNIEFFTTLQYVRLSDYARQTILPCAVKLATEGDSIAEDLLLTMIELRLDHNLSHPEQTVALPLPKSTLGHLRSARALAVTYKFLSYDRSTGDFGHGNCSHYGIWAVESFLSMINAQKAREYRELYDRSKHEASMKGMFEPDNPCAGWLYVHSMLFPRIKSDWENNLIHLRYPEGNKGTIDFMREDDISALNDFCVELVHSSTGFFRADEYPEISDYERDTLIPCAVRLAMRGDSIAEDLLLSFIDLKLDQSLSQPKYLLPLPLPEATLGHLNSRRALALTYKYLSLDRQNPNYGYGDCIHGGMLAFRTFVNMINLDKAIEYKSRHDQLFYEAARGGRFAIGWCGGMAYIHSKLFPIIKSDWENGLIQLRSDTDEK